MGKRFSPPLKGITAAVGSLFGIEKSNGEHEVITHDDDGRELYKEDIIADINEQLQLRKNQRSLLEQQWTLNANYLVGNQYCDINTYRGDIAQLEPVYDWLERETFNQIAPLIETRIANLKKISYSMRVKPATNELCDLEKAEVSTCLLEHTQKTTDFETQKNSLLYWNELCGSCFVLSWWDPNGGNKVAEEHTTVTSDDGSVKTQKTAFYEGAIDYGLITPYEVYPENIFKQGIKNQRSIILEQVKSVADVYDLYGIKAKGGKVETFQLTPLTAGGGFGYENTVMSVGHTTVENACKVVTYFERPGKHLPGGRMIIIVDGEHLVYYGDLPYGRIPLVQTVCIETPGQFFGKSVIERLIPLQRAYNGCINRIHEYIKRIAIGSYAVEDGSIDIEEYEQQGLAPGAFLTYRQGSSPPVPLPNGNLPQEIMNERYALKNDLEYAAGVSQLMVSGNTPTGITSGAAIQSLVDIDNTRLSLTGDHIRNSVRDLAIMWLEIYKLHAKNLRVVNFTGTNNIGKALVWSREDINSFDVEYVAENELLNSEEMQRQRFLESFNMGFFTDSSGRIPERVKMRGLECMKVNNYSDMMSINTLQIQAADRENAFLESGILPEISEFDDHAIHTEEHLRYVLQMDFRLLKQKSPALAAAMEQHIKQHKTATAQQAASFPGGMIPGMTAPTEQ